MKSYIKNIFILLISLSTEIHSAPQLLTRNLIMLLDHDVETPYTERFGIMSALIPALIQKVAPIIVSPSLWNNFIVRKKNFESDPDKGKLISDPFEVSSRPKTVKLNFVCYATPFDPKEWVVKKITNIAYVLIPTAYIQRIENSTPQSFKSDIPMLDAQKTLFWCYKKDNTIDGNLTLRELLIGLKIDHCEDIANPLAPVDSQEMSNQRIAMESFDWTEFFVTRKDLGLSAPTPAGTKKVLPSTKPAQAKKRWEQMTQAQKEQRIELSAQEKQVIKNYTDYQKTLLDAYKKTPNNLNTTMDAFEQYMFPWFIYLTGHGSPEEWGTIASFTVNKFLEFIRFLNFSINTKLFFYDSCYAGGQHTDPTFQYAYISTKKTFKKVPYNLNFTVVAGALTDHITVVDIPYIYPQKMKLPEYWDITVDGTLLAMSLEINYQQFFEELEKYFTYTGGREELKKKTLPDITDMVHQFKRFGVVMANRINNIPLIRLPNSEWFKALDLDKNVNIIDEKTITKYLQTPKPFEIDKNILLVYEPYIPMKIIFKTRSTSIPMNTQKNDYYFENIENTFVRSSQPFRELQPLTNAQSSSNYYIKKYDVVLSNNSVYPGELGKPEYTNKKITLTNVMYIVSQGMDIASFTLIANKKPYYYELYSSVSPQQITSPQEIQEYLNKFTTEEKKLTSQYEEFKQKIQVISGSVEQKIKTPDVQTLIDERKLINALNSLTESLNQLKISF